MDAHYDIVMRARESLANAPARQYFAYSTVLDRTAFLEWRSQHGYDFFELPEGRVAEALDVDIVFDFPSRFFGGRVAGLKDIPAGGHGGHGGVFGRVFEVDGVDWPIIQHKEGYITSMCVEREVRVRVGDREITATAFTTNPARRSSDGIVSPRFLEAFLRGARTAGLPKAYIDRVEAIGRQA